MKKKKGISFEEKRQRLLSIFTTDPTFYHIKEIEKLGSKKGIHPMIVKDVLDSLIADNLVDMEKVGASSYYLALPSKTFLNKQNALHKMAANIEYKLTYQRSVDKEIEKMEEKITAENKLRVENDDREEMLTQLKKLNEQIEKNEQALKVYERNDPQRIKELERTTKELLRLEEMVIIIVNLVERQYTGSIPMDEE